MSGTASAYLATLPVPIQAELVTIARAAIGMTGEEKGYAAATFATVGLHFAQRPSGAENDLFVPAAEMFAALALILRLANNEATASTRPDTEG